MASQGDRLATVRQHWHDDLTLKYCEYYMSACTAKIFSDSSVVQGAACDEQALLSREPASCLDLKTSSPPAGRIRYASNDNDGKEWHQVVDCKPNAQPYIHIHTRTSCDCIRRLSRRA